MDDRNTTAHPAGQPVLYKGTDLIQVDCKTGLITAVHTSQDLINLFNTIGLKFGTSS